MKKRSKINKKETIRNLKLAFKYSKGKRRYLVYYLIMNILLSVVGVAVPIITAKALVYITGSLWRELFYAAIILTVVEISRNLFRFIFQKFSNLYYRSSLTDIQVNVAEEILKLETKEIDKNSSGIFIDRLKKDSTEIADILLSITFNITSFITDIGIYIAVFILNKWMFLFFTFGIILLLYFKKMRLKAYFERDKIRRKINDENTGLFNEFVRGIRDIKVLNSDKEFLVKLKSKILKSNDEQYNMQKITRKYEFITGSILDLLNFGFIILGITLSTMGTLSPASFIVLYNYQYKIYNTLDYYYRIMEQLASFNVACNRVFEILDSKKYKKEVFGDCHLNKVNGDFEFKNVSFAYDKKVPVLNNVSFKIKANETVAFVGKSGAGKSTIFSLLTKLYPIKKGNILIDGVDINKLDKDSIRNNISIITQNPYIFNFSIKDNLKVVKKNATMNEIIEVCKMASIHDFIMSLPHKYETIVGEGGLTLSGGQRQRLAIARALLKKTEIILFDEATSALDNETQTHITNAINNMKGEYTILIIAHRLSTIINCNKIIFMNNGKVITEGTHEELMKNNKEYKLLYESEMLENN